MIIRRKVFSRLMDENNEEKLFCVNETELCYEEREFSEKDEDEKESDEDPLEDIRTLDKLTYIKDRYLTPKQMRKINRAHAEGRVRETAKENGKLGAVIGGVTGAVAGAMHGASKGSVKNALAEAGVGAVAGAAGYGALAAAGGAASAGVNKTAKKISPRYDEKTARRRDQYDLADGKITPKEFRERHYKNTTEGKRYI